jgi:hypothetical protein
VLDAQVFVNLLLQLAVGVNLVGHDNFFVEGLSKIALVLTPQDMGYCRPAATARAWDFTLLLER